MRGVAQEVNMVTVFVRDGRIFWYTPTSELLLCGHGTIAACCALHASGDLDLGGSIDLVTREGFHVTARLAMDGTVCLDFPASPIKPIAPGPDHKPLWQALFAGDNDDAAGAAAREKDPSGPPPCVVALEKTQYDLLVVLSSTSAVDSLDVDHASLGRWCASRSIRGIIVTALEEERQARGATAREGSDVDWNDSESPFDIVSRFFAPAAGLNEDPVCGSAHCALGPSWMGRVGREDFVGVMRGVRPGRVRARVRGDRVHLGGKAVAVARSELL